MNLVKTIIRRHLQDRFGGVSMVHQSSCKFPEEPCSCRRPAKIQYDTELITGGYIDSFSMVPVLIFLEKQFNIKIPDKEATPNNFNSVNSMATLVQNHIKQ